MLSHMRRTPTCSLRGERYAAVTGEARPAYSQIQDDLGLTHVGHARGMPAASILDTAGEHVTNDRHHRRLEGD
jgi:hypothetical protein